MEIREKIQNGWNLKGMGSKFDSLEMGITLKLTKTTYFY